MVADPPGESGQSTPEHHRASVSQEHAGLLRTFAALGSGEALARVIAFGATAYVAHRLGAESLGVIAFAAAIVLYLSRIADAGLDLGIGIREVAAQRDRLDELVPPLLTLRLALAIPLVVLCALGSRLLPPNESLIVILYAVTLLPVAVGTRWVLTGLERTRIVAAARAGGELLMLLGVIAIVRTPGQLWGVPVMQIVGDTAAAVALALVVRRAGVRLRLAWNGDLVRSVARRATPYVGSTLLGLVIYNSDLIFLRIFRDIATVGQYAAAYALVSFLTNIGVTFSLALLPALTRLERTPAVQATLFEDSGARAMVFSLPLAVGGAVVAGPLLDLTFGSEFRVAGPILAILLASVPIAVLRDVAVAALLSKGREERVFRVVAVAAVTNVALNLLLVPRYGMPGAAVATVTTEALRLVLSAHHARALGFPALPLVRGWRPAVVALAMAIVVLSWRPSSLWLSVPVAVVIYGTGLVMVGVIRVRRNGLPRLEV